MLEEEDEEDDTRENKEVGTASREDGQAGIRKGRDGDPCLARGSSKNRIVSQAEVECNMSRVSSDGKGYVAGQMDR